MIRRPPRSPLFPYPPLFRSVFSARPRPSPWHLGRGSRITAPSPAQLGQGDTERNCPNIERAARRTSPVPPHVRHVVGCEPGAAPVPPHAVQRSRVRTLTVLVVPVATSASVSLRLTFRS